MMQDHFTRKRLCEILTHALDIYFEYADMPGYEHETARAAAIRKALEGVGKGKTMSEPAE